MTSQIRLSFRFASVLRNTPKIQKVKWIICKFPSVVYTIIKANGITTVHAQLEMENVILKLTKQSCTPLILYTNKAFLIDTAQVFVSQEGFMQ